MAYGFNLGQIEGLDSSVKTVTLTIANATYTLTYDGTGIGDMWTDPDTSSGLSVQIADVTNYDCYLFNENLASSDVGDVYNITLSTERVEPNFKAAVKESIAPIQIDMPNIVVQKIQLALGRYASDVISNAGKICTLPDVVIRYGEYADPEEQAIFKSFSRTIAEAATFNPGTSVYFGGFLITGRGVVSNGGLPIGGSLSVSFENKTNNMRFKISFDMVGFYDGESIRLKMDVVYPVVLS